MARFTLEVGRKEEMLGTSKKKKSSKNMLNVYSMYWLSEHTHIHMHTQTSYASPYRRRIFETQLNIREREYKKSLLLSLSPPTKF